ncbi:MAG: c-type cytochrome [Gallionella sp.]|nr:MAG: c-type cytochrome [Gallionella sp.]
MKAQWIGIAAATAALMFAGQASAMDAEAGKALLKKNGCLNCHGIDSKVMGPSYKEVSAKYAGNADAKAKLVGVIKNGSKGAWGAEDVMPPMKKVTDEDSAAMVDFILSIK